MESNFNRHLGSKLRMRRLSLGLTQTKVAQAINVTFQQIQKYEKGTNGISSLRIMQLANFLKVPVVFFFEDFPLYQGSNLNDNSSTEEKKEIDLNYSFLAKLIANLDDNQKRYLLLIYYNRLEYINQYGSIKKVIYQYERIKYRNVYTDSQIFRINLTRQFLLTFIK